jgi:hypothetical protein
VDTKFIHERQGKTVVDYAGLLDLAHRRGLKRISTKLLQAPTVDNGHTCICWAEVEMEYGTFSGIGDANPQSVGKAIALHIIRMGETRSKARALRDALNINGTAREELGPDDDEASGELAGPSVRQLAAMPGSPRESPAAGTPANRPADSTGNAAVAERRTSGTGPATTQQIDRLLKLQAALGRPTQAPEGLSFEEAAHQITELVRTFNAQARGGHQNART